MLEILISGVSTRRYEPILPEMAGTVGVSKSQVSRATIEAGERLLDGVGNSVRGLGLVRTVSAPGVTHLKFARTRKP